MFSVPHLSGPLAALEPLTLTHLDDLTAAANENRSSYGSTRVSPSRDEMSSYIEDAMDASRLGLQIPFAVRRISTGRIVGTTSYLDLDVFTWPPPWPPGVVRGPAPDDLSPPTVAEIGSTWYSASAQGTGVNLDCKVMMFRYAFEVWECIRVTLKTDARNARSRAAIESLGAVFEGVRRAHAPAVDGSARDTAYYSVIASEWPAVQARLEERLASKTAGRSSPRAEKENSAISGHD